MNVPDQIAALQTLSTAELAAEYRHLHGRWPRHRSVPWLKKRIAFKLQENAFGGLSRVAREALDALRADIAMPSAATAVTLPAPTTNATLRPGRVLEREWHGQRVRVVTTADGEFEWNGERYGSLSAVAFAITGAKWNGKLFFNLVRRKRA